MPIQRHTKIEKVNNKNRFLLWNFGAVINDSPLLLPFNYYFYLSF